MAPPVSLGQDGWISVAIDADLSAHVHLTPRERGALAVTGIFLEADEITTETFRRVNPNRIVAMAREQLTRGSYDRIWKLDGTSAPGPGPTEAGQVRLSSFATAADGETALGDLRRRVPEATGEPDDWRREPLGRPQAGHLDDFYYRVAEAYMSAATESSRPASVLAEENETPVNTVYKWVREARRRGHLEPGRQGRVG